MNPPAKDQRTADLELLIAVASRSDPKHSSATLHRIRNHFTSGKYLSQEQFQSALDTLLRCEFIALGRNPGEEREHLVLTERGKAWLTSNFRLVAGERFMWVPLRDDWQIPPPPSEDARFVPLTDNEGSADA